MKGLFWKYENGKYAESNEMKSKKQRRTFIEQKNGSLKKKSEKTHHLVSIFKIEGEKSTQI